MLRESVTTTLPGDAPELKKPPTHEEMIEERLDLVVEYLRRAERRDRLRMTGGLVRNLIALIPLVAFLVSLWYVYAYGESLIRQIAADAARQTVQSSQEGMGGLIDQVRGMLQGGGSSSSVRR